MELCSRSRNYAQSIICIQCGVHGAQDMYAQHCSLMSRHTRHTGEYQYPLVPHSSLHARKPGWIATGRARLANDHPIPSVACRSPRGQLQLTRQDRSGAVICQDGRRREQPCRDNGRSHWRRSDRSSRLGMEREDGERKRIPGAGGTGLAQAQHSHMQGRAGAEGDREETGGSGKWAGGEERDGASQSKRKGERRSLARGH